MKKFDLPLILDTLFYTACAFLLAVGILRYLRAATWIVFTASALIALAAGTLSFLLIYKNHRKKGLTKQAHRERDALMLHLALERTDRVIAALAAAYRADGKEAAEGEEAVTVDGTPVIPLFTMQPVSADAVALLLRRHGNYALFTRTGTTPSPLICGEIPRFKLKTKLKRTFSKANARPFFVSGSLLLLMSLFTFFPLYYLITGSLLLAVAVCVRLLGYA